MMTDAATQHALWERGLNALPASQREAIRALREVVQAQALEQPRRSSLASEIAAMQSPLLSAPNSTIP